MVKSIKFSYAVAQNIKDSLLSYTNSTILKQEINDAYEELKLNISMLDANIKVIAENASNKTIIVGNDLFKFLEKNMRIQRFKH